MLRVLGISAFLFSSVVAQAQRTTVVVPGPVRVDVDRSGRPVYRVEVVERTIPAIPAVNFRDNDTDMDLRGTGLLPRAHGDLEVETKGGYTKIEAKFRDMAPASSFGPEYMTYVMWAITPEGRAHNLGEVRLGREGTDDDRKMTVTTELQAFGVIVTAEPYFTVTQPSDIVVMESLVRPGSKVIAQPVVARYQLLKRGAYVMNVPSGEVRPVVMVAGAPNILHQARNAVRIARWNGGERYASDVLRNAESALAQAEAFNADRRKESTERMARQAAQTAEDARLLALRRMEEERLANEQRAAAEARERAAAESARAEQQARLKVKAEADARREAERRAEEAERRARAESERAVALASQQQAQVEAERQRLAAERARLQVEQAEREKAELRERLREQLNMVLETRETARGLIVNMSDVLFDTGQATLRPGAREKLARIAGILMAHPGLKLEIEGHTDSVGSDSFNQQLSERRAFTVRDYLASQGVPMASVTARGFGEASPVASNNTAAGRQQNRRVEIVVSGDIIAERRTTTTVTPRR